LIYFTSDTHFYHTNIIGYCNRPFSSVEEMNAAIIKNWNDKVSKDDVVYVLGDVGFAQPLEIIALINSLNGSKNLVVSNMRISECFNNIEVMTEIRYRGDTFVLCHYPMVSWNKAHYGSYHLHGHCHGKLLDDDNIRRTDVGVDCCNYAPISIEEVIAKLSPRNFAKYKRGDAILK
jgi:calcineurin-like phosphoesterase family protein